MGRKTVFFCDNERKYHSDYCAAKGSGELIGWIGVDTINGEISFAGRIQAGSVTDHELLFCDAYCFSQWAEKFFRPPHPDPPVEPSATIAEEGVETKKKDDDITD